MDKARAAVSSGVMPLRKTAMSGGGLAIGDAAVGDAFDEKGNFFRGQILFVTLFADDSWGNMINILVQ